MFIQKNSGSLKNDNEGNMTQNKLRTAAQRVLRSRWYLALVNLLIVGGAIVVPGELVLGENAPPIHTKKCWIGGCVPLCQHKPDCERGGTNSEAVDPAEQIMRQIKQFYPAALEQLKKDDPQAIQKLYRIDTETLQKLQELAPASKKEIQELMLNSRREWRNQPRDANQKP